MSKIEEFRKHFFECQASAVRRESSDDATDEEIEKRTAELKNYTLQKESINNRFRNPALHRIWNSPPRFKKD